MEGALKGNFPYAIWCVWVCTNTVGSDDPIKTVKMLRGILEWLPRQSHGVMRVIPKRKGGGKGGEVSKSNQKPVV